MVLQKVILCFFFNDPATTEIYTLSLHDALPIDPPSTNYAHDRCLPPPPCRHDRHRGDLRDRKSTRLNSSHTVISYAVFCLKKKKKKKTIYNKKKKKKKKKKTNNKRTKK